MFTTNQIKRMKSQVDGIFKGSEIEHYIKDEMLFISIKSPKNKLIYNFSKGNSEINLTIGVAFEDNDLVFKHFDLMQSGNVIKSDIKTSLDNFYSLEESAYELLSQYKHKQIVEQIKNDGELNLSKLSLGFKGMGLELSGNKNKLIINSASTNNTYVLNFDSKDGNIEFDMYLNKNLITQSKQPIKDTVENRIAVFNEFSKISLHKDHQKLLYLSENNKLSGSLTGLSIGDVAKKVLQSKSSSLKGIKKGT